MKKIRTAKRFGLFLCFCCGQSEFQLHLDFNFNTAGEFEFHQCVNGLSGRAIDVDEALEVRELELLTRLLVDEC